MVSLRPIPPDDPNTPTPPLGRRLLWMAVLMVGGVTVVATAAYVLRGLLFI